MWTRCLLRFSSFLDPFFEGVGEDKNKNVKISSSFLPGRDLTQVSCSIRVEGRYALESADLVQERQENFNIDVIRGDVRDAVTYESSEVAAAALQGTRGCSWPGVADAKRKGSAWRQKIQFFVKGRRSWGTEVIRGMDWESFKEVLGLEEEDAYLMYMGRVISSTDSLAKAGISDHDTVN